MRFEQPTYQDTLRKIFEFEKYNNNTDFFIELDYFVNRDNFVSELNDDFNKSKPLDTYLCAENGKKIFRNFNIFELSSKGYRLIKEEIAVVNYDEDVYKITETYGYAPSDYFIEQDTEIVQMLGYETKIVGGIEVSLKPYTLQHKSQGIVEINGVCQGDVVYFTRGAAYWKCGLSWRTWYGLVSAFVRVDNDLGIISMPGFITVSKISESGEPAQHKWYGGQEVMMGDGPFPSPHLWSRCIPSKSQIVPVENIVIIWPTKPDMIRKTVLVNRNGVEVGDAKRGEIVKNLYNRKDRCNVSVDFSEYAETQGKQADTFWVVEDNTIERVGNLWKQIIKVSEPLLMDGWDIPENSEDDESYKIYLGVTESNAGYFMSFYKDPEDELKIYKIVEELSYMAMGDVNNSLKSPLVYVVKEQRIGYEQKIHSGTIEWNEKYNHWIDPVYSRKVVVNNNLVYPKTITDFFVEDVAPKINEYVSDLNLNPESEYVCAYYEDNRLLENRTIAFDDNAQIWVDKNE